MAFRHMVGILFIACLIIFHVDCAPRVERDGETVIKYGSGYGDADAGAYDLGESDLESSEEDPDNPESDSSETARPESPVDDGNEVDFGNKMDLGKGFGKNTPTTTSVSRVTDEDSYEYEDDGAYEDDYEDNSINISDGEKDPPENAFVSIHNSGVDTGPKETPLNPHFVDKDIELEFGEDEKSSGIPNERDQFFGKPVDVLPKPRKTEVGKVGVGAQRTDVMIVFDDGGYDSNGDSQEGGTLTKGDYKKDDFFDTIGPKKLDDFIPKGTETKKAQDFIEGRTTASYDIFEEISSSLVAPMKDDFFDSIADKNIATLKTDLKLPPPNKDNKVGASVAKLRTDGPENQLTFEEEQKMKRLVLQALQVFTGSACLTGDNILLPKCAVLQDVLKALTISGMTFGVEKKIPKSNEWKRSWC